MKFDLFITDYDNTFGNTKGINKENVLAVKKFMDKGGKFCVCTGRPYQSIKKILNENGIFSGFVGCLQGAEIRDLKTGEVLYFSPVDRKISCKIILDMLKDNMIPNIWTKDALYYDVENYYTEWYKSQNCVPLIKVDNIINAMESQNLEVLKVVSCCKDEFVESKMVEYNSKYGTTTLFNSGSKDIIECVEKDSTKGKTLKFIAKKYNVPLERVIAVGDSSNDIEMVIGSWHGVAVGDAKQVLKNCAKEITVPFSENPVKFLLEKYCL